jgi:two-component system cell cycle response regulator CtrA
MVSVYNYNLIILDIALPDVNGLQIIKQLRNWHINTPVLVISADTSLQMKISALDSGSDDFMVKPFVGDDLCSRVHAIIRRTEGHSSSIITVGQLTINLKERLAYAANERLPLTTREYQILESLAIKKNCTVSKDMLSNNSYVGLSVPDNKIFDVYICKIRNKLARILGPIGKEYIQTIWGRGLILRSPTEKHMMNTDHISTIPRGEIRSERTVENIISFQEPLIAREIG